MHILKDDVYDDNNIVIRSIYHALVNGTQGLEWLVNGGRFIILGKINQKPPRTLF